MAFRSNNLILVGALSFIIVIRIIVGIKSTSGPIFMNQRVYDTLELGAAFINMIKQCKRKE